jgi:anti-sigma B factor antagonist
MYHSKVNWIEGGIVNSRITGQMFEPQEFKQLVVQAMPDAGLLVKFRQSRIMESDDVHETRAELMSLVAPERLLLIDFTNVDFLSSPVIGALLGAQKELKKIAGSITICGLHAQFEELFRVLHLEKSFEIYPDLESALRGNSGE